jgi:hypothetical protein
MLFFPASISSSVSLVHFHLSFSSHSYSPFFTTLRSGAQFMKYQ